MRTMEKNMETTGLGFSDLLAYRTFLDCARADAEVWYHEGTFPTGGPLPCRACQKVQRKTEAWQRSLHRRNYGSSPNIGGPQHRPQNIIRVPLIFGNYHM